MSPGSDIRTDGNKQDLPWVENEDDMEEGNNIEDANREWERVDQGLVERKDDEEGQGAEDRSQPDAEAVDDHRDVARDEDEGVDVSGDHLPARRLGVDKFPHHPSIEDASQRTLQTSLTTRYISNIFQLYPHPPPPIPPIVEF